MGSTHILGQGSSGFRLVLMPFSEPGVASEDSAKLINYLGLSGAGIKCEKRLTRSKDSYRPGTLQADFWSVMICDGC